MAFSQFLLAFISAMIRILHRVILMNVMNAGLGEAIMEKRKQVLIVTNAITEEEVMQIRQAFNSENASQNVHQVDIKLNLVHVIPYLPTCYFNIPSMGMLVEKYYDEAKESLRQVGQHLKIAKKDQWLISGKVRTEVLRLANKLNSSFILASAQQIQELQRSLFFKNIHQYALIRNINQLKQL
jgi:hypothetical protein